MSNSPNNGTRNVQVNRKPLSSATSPFKTQNTNDLYDTSLFQTHTRSKANTRPTIHGRSQSHGGGEDIKPSADWTSLIPPMPSQPKQAYRPTINSSKSSPATNLGYGIADQDARMYRNQAHPNEFSALNTQVARSSNQSLKPMQRHSIAISPISSHHNLKDQVIEGDDPKGYDNVKSSNVMANNSTNNDNITNINVNHNDSTKQTNNSNTNSNIINNHNPLNTNNEVPINSNNSSVSNVTPCAPTEEYPPLMKSNSIKTPTRSKTNRKKKKICHKCGLEITGQFVRALRNAYHVACFSCDECGKQCSARFFPYDMTDSTTGNHYQVALCEYDYFKKLDLICHNCNSALRGPYITALGYKYHLEHFKCAVCQKVFESDESYYKHEGNIFCHYHYSSLYASHCEGCHSSIVKQFVELYRGGRNQQWHPECYMVHKFWNVCISASAVGLQKTFDIPTSNLDLADVKNSTIQPDSLLSIEQQIENTVMSCWLTLSGYEETAAGCISDMLLNACTGNQANGLFASGKLILNVEILFKAIDYVQSKCDHISKSKQIPATGSSEHEFYQPLRKEPRNISGKIMSYLAILRKSASISSSGSLSSELLSVITGCAHYLKLLIRIGLSNSLKVNEITGTPETTERFLLITKGFEEISDNGRDSKSVSDQINARLYTPLNATDACYACSKSIERACARFEGKRWHLKCFKCSNCSELIQFDEIEKAACNTLGMIILCENCSSSDADAKLGFSAVSNLSQLVYLLKIALFRSKSVMHIDDNVMRKVSVKQPNIQKTNNNTVTESDYSKTLTDVTRLRTKRQSQKLSNSIKQNARKSVILEAPKGDKAWEDVTNDEGIVEESDSYAVDGGRSSDKRKMSASSHLSFNQKPENEQFNVKSSLKIRDEPLELTNNHLNRTSDLLKNEKSLTLDDIPRIVAAEQAREQRPNAFKHHNSLYQRQKPLQPVKNVAAATSGGDRVSTNGVHNATTSDDIVDNFAKRKFYSELTDGEHTAMRYIALEGVTQILGNSVNRDELLTIFQTKKSSNFWDKLKFGGDQKKDKVNGVFGVKLADLTKKYGVDSDLGVGPSKLRIPIVTDDVISALKQKDMSIEGIFRLNGNIKKLKELTDEINKNPLRSPDFSDHNAVQLAALMKKWLRELPDPLLTFTLYEIWISSQRSQNAVKRKKLLQLAYCMLPRSHRNLLEVLLSFFSWVASFAEIDEETGSKMDVHNLATVIAPNILYAKQSPDQPHQPRDTYFLAIEVVNQLIEMHEEMSVVPPDMLAFFDKCGFSGDNISTKEVLNRLDKVTKENPGYFQDFDSPAEEPANQEFRSNTVSRGHSGVQSESQGETSVV